MRFGCHAVLFKEKIKTETESVIKGLSEAGFSGVEIGARFFGVDDKQRLEEILNKYDMQLSGLHVLGIYEQLVENPDEFYQNIVKAAEFVKDMPSKNVVMSGVPASILSGGTFDESERQDYKVIASTIEEAAKACLEMGVKLSYHNHDWEFKNNGEIFNALVEFAPSLYFGLDLGWVSAGGFDPIDTLNRVKDRVVYVHLRDPKEKNSKEFLNLGEGCFNFSELLGAVKDTLPEDGWAIVEYEFGEISFERYKAAKDFIDSVHY
ncbi:sugar phosphate isomerase/epimerase family protein [Neobacillus cucumis]|uniref:sugar phosphate isomerase/epimerase family protein n=1 Tax=Neobacillus cucumis TaxID=1740721 RepID=UPI002E242CDE|nr:sugar phosphate isomerase/epimerase [Neobacillus cucumis]